MSVHADFLPELEAGLGAYLSTIDPDVLYDPPTYDPTESLICVIRQPFTSVPERQVRVTAYDHDPLTPGLDLIQVAVQLHLRADKDYDLAARRIGLWRNRLHEQAGLQLGAVRASLIIARTTGYLGADSNGRQEFTLNLTVRSDGQVQTLPDATP